MILFAIDGETEQVLSSDGDCMVPWVSESLADELTEDVAENGSDLVQVGVLIMRWSCSLQAAGEPLTVAEMMAAWGVQ